MKLVELGTILHMDKGKKPQKQQEKYKEGYLPYVDIQAFEEGIIKSYADPQKCLLCEDGDLLIVCDGSRSGLTGRAIKGVVGSTLSKISADGLCTEYLQYFIQSKYTLLNTRKKGTGTPHLNAELLKKSKLVIPTQTEQERIVSKIEELFSKLDASVVELKTAKEKLKVYRQAVLKEAFDAVSESPRAKIQHICEYIIDCPHSTPKWTNAGKICLRTTNFKRGYLDLREKNYVSEETFNARNSRLIPASGDVLYSREGAILGIACIIPAGLSVCLGQRMMLLRTNEENFNRFLMHYLNSPAVTNYVASITGGSASPHVNVRDIKNFLIPVPKLDVQKRTVLKIEERISICDDSERSIDTAIQQAEALRQSILKQAFEGRLIE